MPAPQLARMRPLVTTAVVVVTLIVLYLVFVQLWTRKLWFDSLDFTIVFGTQLTAQVVLFAVFFLVMLAVLAVNLVIAARERPAVTPPALNPSIDRYRKVLTAHSGWVIAIVSGIAAIWAGTRWQW